MNYKKMAVEAAEAGYDLIEITPVRIGWRFTPRYTARLEFVTVRKTPILGRGTIFRFISHRSDDCPDRTEYLEGLAYEDVERDAMRAIDELRSETRYAGFRAQFYDTHFRIYLPDQEAEDDRRTSKRSGAYGTPSGFTAPTGPVRSGPAKPLVIHSGKRKKT